MVFWEGHASAQVALLRFSGLFFFLTVVVYRVIFSSIHGSLSREQNHIFNHSLL